MEISGLAGAVSLAGSDSGLWSVEGGNWQMAAGLIERSNATLHLNEEIISISFEEGKYELKSEKGNRYICDVAVIASPLDELNISFSPLISIPKRKLQHTHATFVRGLLNPVSFYALIFRRIWCDRDGEFIELLLLKEYFGLDSASEVPDLVGTMEDPEILFSSIGVWKKYSEGDKAYKVFSRSLLEDELLDRLFR